MAASMSYHGAVGGEVAFTGQALMVGWVEFSHGSPPS